MEFRVISSEHEDILFSPEIFSQIYPKESVTLIMILLSNINSKDLANLIFNRIKEK